MTAEIIDLNLKRTERSTEFLRAATERGNAVYAAWKAAEKPKDATNYEWDNELGQMVATIHVGDPGDES